MVRLVYLTALLCLPLAVLAQDDAGRAEPDAYLELAVVRDAELSPTGEHVAWRELRNHFEDDRRDEQLWVGSTSSEQVWQLTRGEHSVGDYEWSSDGRWLAFTRDDAAFLIRADGGEAIELEIEGVKNVRDMRFAPDGAALYFLGVAEPDDRAEAREEAYGEYMVFREEGQYVHLWRQPLTDAMEPRDDPEALTAGEDFSLTEFALSPDGQQIAFAASRSPHLVDLLNSKVYRVDAEGGEAAVLADEPGADRGLVWRADGTRLAFTARPGFADYAAIVTIAADGSDRRVFDMPEHDADLVSYAGSTLLFEAGLRTHYGRYELDMDSGAITALDESGYQASTSVSADGATRAFIGAPDGGLAEVFLEDAEGRRMLTDYNDQLADVWQPRQTLVQWQSFDGLEIEGVLTWPRGYIEGQSYPLFLRTHGGPTGTDRPGLIYAPRSIYLPAVLSARGNGAFVLQTNYRGSAGYGDSFQKTNLRQLGIGPARDIIAGAEKLIADGLVDRERVGCLGWSQGGHISAMLATYSDLCTAAIMGAGISDWRTYYYNTDITQFTTQYFGATPLDDDDVYALTSPVTYIESANTPVLIQHGELDARVPIANGYQFRQLLLDRGVESRMIVYAGMGHGPRTPRHLRAINEHALAWFDEHLFAAERADFVRPVEPEGKDNDDPQGEASLTR